VILNTIVDRKVGKKYDTIGDVLAYFRRINPNVKFILTSERAAVLTPEERATLDEYGVMGIVEKPFHFADVVDVMEGTYEGKKKAAHEEFRIEASERIFNSFEKAHSPEAPGVIRLWTGYAPLGRADNIVTRIEKETREGAPYRVDFDELEELVEAACREAQNEDFVTILPHNLLTPDQRERLAESKARVIFIDIEGDDVGGVTPLPAMIFAGAAYLEGKDAALARFYRLLTDTKATSELTVARLMNLADPFIFTLKLTEIIDPAARSRLNEMMERVLEMA